MDIEVTSIDVDNKSIVPAFVINAKLTYYYNQEAPIAVDGRIITADGKTISLISEYQMNKEVSIGLKILDEDTRNIIYGSGGKYKYFHEIRLVSFLHPNAINYIENLREADQEKSVVFNLYFLVKYLNTPSDYTSISNVRNHDPLISVQIKNCYCQFSIKQSDWINKYSPLLGIGNFLLIELKIPDKCNVPDAWSELHERLVLRIKEMEDAIRYSDWQKVMTKARQFFENLKFDIRFAEERQFKEQLKQLFIDDRHGEEGYEEFNKGISAFFNFSSKFIHDKNRTGKLNPIPIARKEDAYFAYSMAINIVNVISAKLCR